MTQANQASTTHGPRELVKSENTQDDVSSGYFLSNLAKAISQEVEVAGSPREGDSHSTRTAYNDPQPSSQHNFRGDLSAILDFPRQTTLQRKRPTFYALQEWEGYVDAVKDDEIIAQLVDITAGSSNETLEANIPLAEISQHDADNLKVGSIFRWVIGYERSPEGSKKRVSQIVFRDLPRMTENDLIEGERWAHKIMQSLGS